MSMASCGDMGMFIRVMIIRRLKRNMIFFSTEVEIMEVNHDEAHQWTPEMVNHVFFGVRIDTDPPEGRGTVTVYYDLVAVPWHFPCRP